MGQYWEILNVDKDTSTGCLGKFSEFFCSGKKIAAIVKLISSATVKFPRDPLEGQPYKEARKYKSDRTGICDLPCELQDAIFAELRDPVDVFAVCLTASHFWRIGLCRYKALYMDYVRRAKDWSGARLVCLGDAADVFPKGLFTDADLDVLEDVYFDRYGNEPSEALMVIDTFPNLNQCEWPYRWVFTDRCQFEKRNPLACLPQWPKRQLSRRQNKSGVAEDSSEEDFDPGNALPFYLPLYKYSFSDWVNLPKDTQTLKHAKPTILRNLSKKVYVRDDFFPLEKEDTNEDEERDAKPYYLSFGSLLVLRIAWSVDLCLGTPYDKDFCRGSWTGDRFDIVSINAVEHEEGWTDVSTEGKEQLLQIWKEVFGDGWQAEVREMQL